MNKLILLMSKLHGHSLVVVDVFIEFFAHFLLKKMHDFNRFKKSYIQEYRNFSATQHYITKPEDFLVSMAIVQSSYQDGHKGVLTIAYNYAIPSFMYLFDYEKVMTRYHIVLEPSTARLFMPEILICDRLSYPVFVQAGEPRDQQFLQRFSNSLVPVPIAANWWLDTDVFNTENNVLKKYDIIMVSTFTKLKRHYLLFKHLQRLKKKGIVLNAVLIGYAGRYTKTDILNMAKKYQVQDQITVLEGLTPNEVAHYYKLSKVNLLLSTREGTPRTIIEGLHCGTPAMLRKGFNFGYKYPFITNESGAYFSDDTLGQDILDLIAKVDANVIDAKSVVDGLNINPIHAADILRQAIFPKQNDVYVSPKASGLDGMYYVQDSDKERFAEDYQFIMSCLHKP